MQEYDYDLYYEGRDDVKFSTVFYQNKASKAHKFYDGLQSAMEDIANWKKSGQLVLGPRDILVDKGGEE